MIFSKKNNPRGYYVYLYLRDNGTPYYCGKGKDKRAWQRNKGDIQAPRNKEKIVIAAYDLFEYEAFLLEKKLIHKYGRKDLNTGILYNTTDGGDGTSGYKHTEKEKARRSSIRGEFHHSYGTKISDEHRAILVASMTGRKNSLGHKHSETHKARRVKSASHWWKLISPTGEIFEFQNLSEFCRDHDLNNGAMNLVYQGIRTHHKGWKVLSKVKRKHTESV